MEKAAVAHEHSNHWRIAAPDYDPQHPCLSCLDLTCCPCGGYSRVSSHVNSFAAGVPVVVTREDGFFTADCWSFLALLPFYGCLVGRLQSTFRNIHKIEGSCCADCLSGCCCPTSSVTRMEMEAMVRSEERRLLKELPSILEESDSNISLGEAYKCPAPMICPKPVISQLRTEHTSPTTAKVPVLRQSTASRSNRNSDADTPTLATIPEVTPVLSSQQAQGSDVKQSRDEPLSVQVPSVYPKRHSLNDDAVVPMNVKRHSLNDDPAVLVNASTKPWPLLKYLGQKWYMVPPTKKENEEPNLPGGKSNDSVASGRSDERSKGMGRSPDSKMAPLSPRHSLDRDQRYATSAVGPRHAAHGIEDDMMEPIDLNNGRFKEHLLEHDPASSKRSNMIGKPHRLDSDAAHETRPQSHTVDARHDIAADEMTSAPEPTASHDLDAEVTKSGKAGASAPR